MDLFDSGTIFAFSFNLFGFVAKAFQEAVVGLIAYAINLIVKSPEPHLTAAWFRGEYGVMLKLALWLLIPIIFSATISALLHGGLQQVLRTYLWALPIGVFGGVVTIALIEIAIDIDQELTVAVFSQTLGTIQSFYDGLNKATMDTGNAVKDQANGFTIAGWSFIQMILMFFMLFLVGFLIIEMFFREVMIYMGVLFIPFSLAAFIWGPVRVWFYNLCELVMTMVFAKFVIAAIMSFGFTAMAYGLTGSGTFSDANMAVIFGAIVIMIIACMSGPVLVTFVMAPNHSILSTKSAKQITPWNHDRKFAGSLFKANYKSIKEAVGSGGGGGG
jgi:hypothetical protein